MKFYVPHQSPFKNILDFKHFLLSFEQTFNKFSINSITHIYLISYNYLYTYQCYSMASWYAYLFFLFICLTTFSCRFVFVWHRLALYFSQHCLLYTTIFIAWLYKLNTFELYWDISMSFNFTYLYKYISESLWSFNNSIKFM